MEKSEWKELELKYSLCQILQFSCIGLIANTPPKCSEMDMLPTAYEKAELVGIPVFLQIKTWKTGQGISPSAEVARLKHYDEAAV